MCPCSPRCGKSIVFWLLHQIHIVFQHLLFAPLSLRGCRRVPLENLRLNNGGLLMLKQSPRLFLWYCYSCASFGGQAFFVALTQQAGYVEFSFQCRSSGWLQAQLFVTSSSKCSKFVNMWFGHRWMSHGFRFQKMFQGRGCSSLNYYLAVS